MLWHTGCSGMAQSAIGGVEPIGNEEDPGYGVPDLGARGGALVAGVARERGDQLVAQVTQSPGAEACARARPRRCHAGAFGAASARGASTATQDGLSFQRFARDNKTLSCRL